MTQTRILITRRWPEAVERRMAEFGEVTLNQNDHPMTPAEMTAALREAGENHAHHIAAAGGHL